MVSEVSDLKLGQTVTELYEYKCERCDQALWLPVRPPVQWRLTALCPDCVVVENAAKWKKRLREIRREIRKRQRDVA